MDANLYYVGYESIPALHNKLHTENQSTEHAPSVDNEISIHDWKENAENIGDKGWAAQALYQEIKVLTWSHLTWITPGIRETRGIRAERQMVLTTITFTCGFLLSIHGCFFICHWCKSPVWSQGKTFSRFCKKKRQTLFEHNLTYQMAIQCFSFEYLDMLSSQLLIKLSNQSQ